MKIILLIFIISLSLNAIAKQKTKTVSNDDGSVTTTTISKEGNVHGENGRTVIKHTKTTFPDGSEESSGSKTVKKVEKTPN